MTDQKFINELDRLSAFATLLRQGAERLEKDCRKAKETLQAGVSTSATKGRRKVNQIAVAEALAKRAQRMAKKNHKTQSV